MKSTSKNGGGAVESSATDKAEQTVNQSVRAFGRIGAKREISRRPAPGEWVYFIWNGMAVKIGCSWEPSNRLNHLQVGSHLPLEILAQVPAKEFPEKELHQRFGHLLIQGEWFRPEPDLMDFIDAIGLPPITEPAPAVAAPANQPRRPKIRGKSSFFRPLRSDARTWTANASIEAKSFASIYCGNLLELERRPHDTHLAEMAAINLIGLALALKDKPPPASGAID